MQILGDASMGGEEWWKRDRVAHRAPEAMWSLLSLRAGDLVVALEGRDVRGICQVKEDAVKSYRYQMEWDYGQTVGFPVEWKDWREDGGPQPRAPSRGVLGIRGLVDGRDLVIQAWERLSA